MNLLDKIRNSNKKPKELLTYLSEKVKYEQVVDIFFEVDFLKHPEKRKVYQKAIKKAFNNSQYIISAWDKDKLIGFARVITDKSLFATIWNMLIKPEYQTKGIGKQLIQKCLDKYPTCHFFLFADEKVIDFYRKMGFDIHRYGMYLKDRLGKCVLYN